MRTEYFCSFTTPQAFWQSSAPGVLSTLVTSVVLYSLTQATLMSPGKDEPRVCGYIIYISIYLYICLSISVSISIYLSIYLYRERKREKERERKRERVFNKNNKK